MSYQLKIDEMLEVLVQNQNPHARVLTAATEALADMLAAAICLQFGVRSGKASFEGLGFAGTCVAFYGDGPLPEGMEGYDSAEEWGPE